MGRNAVLLLNVPPAPDGRIAAADLANLTSFGRVIAQTYGTNLLAGNSREPNDPVLRAVTDDRLETAWQPPSNVNAGTLTLDLAQPITLDQVRLGEDITQGQQVEQFVIDVWTGSAWRRVGQGTTIGYARIIVLTSPVTTDRLRVQILDARATPRLSFVGAYRTAAPT